MQGARRRKPHGFPAKWPFRRVRFGRSNAAFEPQLTSSVSCARLDRPPCTVGDSTLRRGPMEDAANQIIEHYERHALSWDADRRPAAWTDRPFIERFLDLLPRGASVLDLGCGGGLPVALHMTAQCFRVTGVDSSAAMISLCRTRMPDQEWIVSDMRSLDLGRKFDGLLAWDSFFHSATRISGRCSAYLPRMRLQPLF
jgi:hypothetical protein